MQNLLPFFLQFLAIRNDAHVAVGSLLLPPTATTSATTASAPPTGTPKAGPAAAVCCLLLLSSLRLTAQIKGLMAKIVVHSTTGQHKAQPCRPPSQTHPALAGKLGKRAHGCC